MARFQYVIESVATKVADQIVYEGQSIEYRVKDATQAVVGRIDNTQQTVRRQLANRCTDVGLACVRLGGRIRPDLR